MNTKIIQAENLSLTALTPLVEQAENYVRNSKAKATTKAYKADWKDFTEWAGLYTLCPLPAHPETISLYISDLSNRVAIATIRRRLASISQVHQAAGYETPTASALIRNTWQGIKRTKGTAQDQKEPLLTNHLREIVKLLPDSLSGVRDGAVLLLGIVGAFRRSELVSLDVEHLRFTNQGLIVTLTRSKTDQEATGIEIGIPPGRAETCPVRAVKNWLVVSRITSSALFRGIDRHGNLSSRRLTDQSVALIVKRWAEAIGVDPAVMSGHSLRSGFATQCALNNVPSYGIKEGGRWKTEQMVNRYIRKGCLFKNNPASCLGL